MEAIRSLTSLAFEIPMMVAVKSLAHGHAQSMRDESGRARRDIQYVTWKHERVTRSCSNKILVCELVDTYSTSVSFTDCKLIESGAAGTTLQWWLVLLCTLKQSRHSQSERPSDIYSTCSYSYLLLLKLTAPGDRSLVIVSLSTQTNQSEKRSW